MFAPRLRSFFPLVSLLLLLPLSGCFFFAPDPNACNGPGDLEVSWIFDGIAACPDNVTTVYVQLWRNGEALHKDADGDAYPCENGHILYTGLACGSYDLYLDAADSTGRITWNSAETSHDVFSQLQTSAPLNLRGAP